MFTASGLRVRFLKVCAPSVGLKPFSIWDGKSHSVIHFPGLGEEWLQHCWVGSLHHERWFIWDKVLATNSYKIKVLVTTDIRRSPLSSYPQRSPCVASCMIISEYIVTQISETLYFNRGWGRADQTIFFVFLISIVVWDLCSSLQALFVVGSIFLPVYLAVAFLVCWSIHPFGLYCFLLQMDQCIHLNNSVQTFAAKDLVHCSVWQL